MPLWQSGVDRRPQPSPALHPYEESSVLGGRHVAQPPVEPGLAQPARGKREAASARIGKPVEAVNRTDLPKLTRDAIAGDFVVEIVILQGQVVTPPLLSRLNDTRQAL